MITLANLSNAASDLERFRGERDARDFLALTDMDGFELLLYDGGRLSPLPPNSVVGVHLGYFPSWLPLWMNDKPALAAMFGSLSEARRYYGADSRETFVDNYVSQLEQAKKLRAKYVVFHVSEASLEETVSYKFIYDDRTVIDCAAELINEINKGRRDEFDFLLENLWWPGMNLKDPEITERLFKRIAPKNKGIMLDVGHLMHTEPKLSSPQEALEYVHRRLDAHEDLCRYIKGVHLHQTLNGAYVQKMTRCRIRLHGSYQDKMMQAYRHVMKIDAHKPCLWPGVGALIRRIAPQYLVYELITESKEEHLRFLRAQKQAIERDLQHVLTDART